MSARINIWKDASRPSAPWVAAWVNGRVAIVSGHSGQRLIFRTLVPGAPVLHFATHAEALAEVVMAVDGLDAKRRRRLKILEMMSP